MTLCGVGYDSESDGYDAYMNHYHKTKEEGTFNDLDSELGYADGIDLDDSNSDLAPSLRKKGKELQDDGSFSEIESIHLITDVHCKHHDYS